MFVKLKNLRKWDNKHSKISFEDDYQKKITFLSAVSRIIRNGYENRPASLIHANILSKIVKCPIRIWQQDRDVDVCGKINNGSKAVLEAEYRRKHGNRVGHWSLRGGKDATATCQNGCLYDVVASQSSFKASELKRKATIIIRRQSYIVAKALLATDESLLGGARYEGRSSADAQRILDASQNGQCHPQGSSGHPRGHASHPSTSRSNDTVESYSYSRWRSGFLSRADQDVVCHYTLVTNIARDLMESLNRGAFKEDKHIGRNELDYYPLPQAQIWEGGNKLGSPGDFRTVCLVGKHFLNRHKDAQADLFILTFYPIL